MAEKIRKYVKCDIHVICLLVEQMTCTAAAAVCTDLEVSSFNNAHNWERLWSDLLTMINENSPHIIC